MDDAQYNEIRLYLKTEVLPAFLPSTASNFRAQCAKYELRGGKLFRDEKLVLKESQLDEVWQQCHQHRGIT